MEIERLIPVRIREVPADSPVAWAKGMQVSLPRSTLEKAGLIDDLDANDNLTIPAEIPPINPRDVQDLRSRAAYTRRQPVSSRLPVSYQMVPARLRSLIALVMGRWKRRRPERWATFPRWPLDLSVDFLSDLCGSEPSPFRSGPTPVLLSHDLDSPEGLKNVVRKFLELEEKVGARSSSYIVPCGWPIDYGLLDELKDRGHEVGIHGYDHANRTAFCDPDQQRERLEGASELIQRYDIIGYRSPSLLRTPSLLKSLREFYRYDTSIPTSGGLFPVPNNGCSSARPFQIEGIVEIPISLPRDGSLKALGYSPDESLQFWIRCGEAISRSGGVVVLLTHCEARFSGNAPALDAYRRFLDYVSGSDRYLWSTPGEVLERAFQKTKVNRAS
ncbi:MAG: polysaccharide deacetylase family protein [Acidobacteria bacterium]|nr:polysaccharide deacetylase family protein [Acidobacteriota bacterium]